MLDAVGRIQLPGQHTCSLHDTHGPIARRSPTIFGGLELSRNEACATKLSWIALGCPGVGMHVRDLRRSDRSKCVHKGMGVHRRSDHNQSDIDHDALRKLVSAVFFDTSCSPYIIHMSLTGGGGLSWVWSRGLLLYVGDSRSSLVGLHKALGRLPSHK